MKVGLDLRPLQEGFKGHGGRGIEVYTRSLTEALLREGGGEQLVFLAEDGIPLRWSWYGETLQRVPFPSFLHGWGKDGVHIRQHIIWPYQLWNTKLDLVHFCAQTDAPALATFPYVATVLDLIPHVMAEEYRAGKNLLRFRLGRTLEGLALRRARGLIAVSSSTKRDLVARLRIPEEKIVVIPLGVGEEFRASYSRMEREVVLQRYGVKEPYVLYVGGIDQRKNIPFLFRVFRRLKERYGQPLYLVVGGEISHDPSFPFLRRQLTMMGLEPWVILCGFVQRQDLPVLYHAARVFLFPSLYEGFGLPPLEAMASGLPVVSSNRSSLPEVVGDGGILTDPENEAAFTEAALALLTRPALAREVAEKARKQAEKFSWDKTARQTLDTYQRLVKAR